VHAAAIFSLDPRRPADVGGTNARATKLVLNNAADHGLDPIVHVSTTVALTRYGGSGPDLPLGDITRPYAQSKIASEKLARRLQVAGAPVVTLYPGAASGPNDPYRGLRANRCAGCCSAGSDFSAWRSTCRRRARRRHPHRSCARTARSGSPLHRARPPRRWA
jgi:nucleoside-diphosphate-sugar epimerase